MTDFPNTQSSKRRDIEPPYRPPTFSQLAGKANPPDDVACASCPWAMWYYTDKWVCFCQQMKIATVGYKSLDIKACDGRELALAEYRRQLRGGNAGR